MKIPPNMTEEEVLQEITVVVNRIAPKYTFYGYDANDMKQEAFIMCIDAMERYDYNRPLENFLSVHLSNRLKNFVRDNFFMKDEEEKRRVVMPGQLANEEHLLDEQEVKTDNLDYKNMLHLLDLKLPATYRSDYLKIIHDVYVPKKRKEEVIEVIHEILGEHGHA
tara:strand:- start:1702 stop:2196 length:495 start_codon:yes stop_codon:yes gene_type:complete